MALRISETCIYCGACVPVCPTRAISSDQTYTVDPRRCAECAQIASGPQCAQVCPVDALTLDAPVARREYLQVVNGAVRRVRLS